MRAHTEFHFTLYGTARSAVKLPIVERTLWNSSGRSQATVNAQLPPELLRKGRMDEIFFVDLKPDKVFHATALRGDGRIPDSEKRIEHCLHAGHAVKLDAPFG